MTLEVPIGITDCRVRFAQRFKALSQSQGEEPGAAMFILPPPNREPAMPLDTELLPPPRTSTLIVPGLLGDSFAAVLAPFFSARQTLNIKGYHTRIAWVNGRRGCDHNAALLQRIILSAANSAGAPVNIIAYSKGCPDVFHMLAKYPETHSAVAALVSYGGVVHGSPLAAETGWITRKLLQYAPLPGIGFGDHRALSDLHSDYREQWLRDNPLPASIRYASVAAAPPRHLVSRVLKPSYDKLASIDPCNDSQVLWRDALIPGSELLAVVQADHWALALPVDKRLPFLSRTLIDKNNFPRRLILRTIMDYLEHEPPGNSTHQ